MTPKLLRFTLIREGKEEALFLATVISRGQKETLQSFRELLDFGGRSAAQSLQGIYGLEILSADVGEGIRNFNPRDFSALLANHGRKLALGGKVLIRYGQIFSVLHKRAPADWGKIEIGDPIDMIDPEKIGLAGFLKKMTKNAVSGLTNVYLVHDIGSTPVWDLESEWREKKLHELLDKNASNAFFYRTMSGCELLKITE